MKFRLLCFAALAAVWCGSAMAQSNVGGTLVADCGTITPPPTGTPTAAITVDATGRVCVNGGGAAPAPFAVTPHAGTAAAIVTGGTAVIMVTGPVNGCQIVNPSSAADQNISTAEVAYLNDVTTATAVGRGTNVPVLPGQSWNCPPGMTTNVSVIAATTGHAFGVTVW